MTGAASPAYGEAELRALAGNINQSKDAAVIFATDPNSAIRQKAIDLLAEAGRRTGLAANATASRSQSRAANARRACECAVSASRFLMVFPPLLPRVAGANSLAPAHDRSG